MILLLIVACTFVIISMIVVKYYKLELVRVSGSSMYPTLLDGRPLLIRKRLNFNKDVKPGRIFVVTSPDGYSVVKRLSEVIFAEGSYYLYILGDNPDHSRDSRHYGYVRADRLEGIAVFNKPKKVRKSNGR